MMLAFNSRLTVSITTAVATHALQPACRRFTLADALILIAGLALVLSMGAHLLGLSAASLLDACIGSSLHVGVNWEGWPRLWREIRKPVIDTIWYGSQFAGTLLFGMTPIFFILRLKRPRPPLRALVVQPGMVAGLAMVFGLFWVMGLVHIVFPERLDSISGPWIAAGGTVATAWLMLCLCRRWKAEAGWVDGIGRLLGAIAIGNRGYQGLFIYRV